MAATGPVAALLLLSPWGAAACAAALLPALAGALAVRRSRRAARTLGLAPEPLWLTLQRGVGLCLGVVLLGLAVAQPAVETVQTRSVRTQSQALFVVDVSRSMLASAAPGAPTRLDRAREIVRQLRAELPDVPAGVAGMTDRVLPYLFPTSDPAVFDLTVRRSVRADAPPPSQDNVTATTFDALSTLAGNGWWPKGARRRACILVTDGESRSSSPGAQDPGSGVMYTDANGNPVDANGNPLVQGADIGGVGSALAGEDGCRLVVIRVGSRSDRIRHADGTLEGQYQPDASAPGKVAELAKAAGGSAYGEGSTAAAAATLKRLVEVGPSRRAEAGRTLHRLAPWLALAGALSLAAGALAIAFGWSRRRVIQNIHSQAGEEGGTR